MRRIAVLLGIWMGLTAWGAEAAAAPAPVEIRAEADESRETVTLFFENVSDQPALLYIDARMAELTLRDGRRTLGRCRAPSGSLPRRPDERRFVRLVPGQVIGEELDLRFLCFGRALDRLDRATTVTATYRSRFGRDRYGNASWTRRIGPVEWTLAEPDEAEDGGFEAVEPLSLRRLGRSPDVQRADAIFVTMELRGPRRSRIPLVVRPESFSFTVRQPGGDIRECRLPSAGVRPLREFYDVIGQIRVPLDLATICHPSTFDRSGIYQVVPLFVSTHDGSDVELEAWTGSVEGSPFLIRVRRAGRRWADPVELRIPRSTAGRGVEADAR